MTSSALKLANYMLDITIYTYLIQYQICFYVYFYKTFICINIYLQQYSANIEHCSNIAAML